MVFKVFKYYYSNINEKSRNSFLIILKLKKCVSMQLNNYLIYWHMFLIITQQMCDKAILENVGTLKSVPYCYKKQEMCNKAVENCPNALKFVFECYKTQKMCDKAVSSYPSTIKFIPECLMTQKMCDKAVNSCCFEFDSFYDEYKIHEICDTVVSEDPSLIVYCSDKC